MHTLGNLSPSRNLKGRIKIRLARIKDSLTFGAFELVAGRQPNDDEYFNSRTRGELLRKAFKAKRS